MSAPTGEPILVPCEGGGYPPTGRTHGLALCAMCGEAVGLDALGNVIEHVRDDVLARLDQGDFEP